MSAMIVMMSISFSFLSTHDTINRLNQEGEKCGWWKITAGEYHYHEYASEAVYEEGNFVNGSKHGVWTTYYPDGSKMYRCIYEEGVLNGKFTSWYNDGYVKERGTWRENHLTDTVFTFYYTGEIESIRVFNSNGAMIGCEKQFKINGTLKEGSKCALDERNSKIIRDGGGVILYDALARPVQKGIFKNGKFISGRIFKYNEQGEIYKVLVYKDGEFLKEEELKIEY